MKKNKKSEISLLLKILIITITGFIIFSIISGGLNKLSAAIVEPIKKKLGIGQDEELQAEQERVGQELAENAINLYTEFGTMLARCMSTDSSRACLCGTADFTRLSNYYLKITNQNSEKFLELLDSRKVPLPERSINIGNFGIGPILPTASVFAVDYRYVLFSKDNVVFNSGASDVAKPGIRMPNVYFVKYPGKIVSIEEVSSGVSRC